MPFGPVSPDVNLADVETRVLARWKDDDIIARVAAHRKDGEPWIFYEGPPTANGRPGLHHVWARVFKDLYPRFQTMRGKAVPRKGGWDCHGLPVELEIEKELGLSTKHEIEAYGVEAFNAKCRESVHRYVSDWTALTERAGVWIDTDNAYWTLDNGYVESVWWLLRQMWDKGLLYEGHRVVPYCSRCGTALSSHELGQPGAYRDVVDPSIYVRFPLDDTGDARFDGADLLVWTTTPWTLISNVAAAVGADITYARVPAATFGVEGRDLIAAVSRLPESTEVAAGATFTGAELAGRRYERPFAFLEVDDPAQAERAWRVITADFVSTDDGSGIVHLAPAFGEDDARACREHGLPVLNPVNADGGFDDRVPVWRGFFVKDADRGIIDDLAARGVLVREQAYEHSYPHCWRCSTPLIYWAKTSWFIRTSEQRDLLLRENEAINWQPPNIKHGRFGNWLEGNIDWALSRDRYWGTPLPIWRCDDCGADTCIGGVAELAALVGRDLTDLDLHRPYVDDVTFPCAAAGCDGTARRLEPVLDAWFDSGSMPSAQFHYPFEHEDLFRRSFPGDFICEAIDQTRGWFYSLLAVNSLVFDATPYRNVVCLGLVVDENGNKMSKSRGNVIDPWDIFETQGADALRWYFFSAGQPWTPRRVSETGIREATRQTLLTLWNCYSFFVTYATYDGWEPPAAPSDLPAPTHVLDRWILSELDRTVAAVTAELEGFDALAASAAIAGFVDDLSNWYVRRSRPRFWKSSDAAAHATLWECLVTVAELLAPFCPFIADELYANLTGAASVHLADWPTDRGRGDEELAAQMAAARRLVGLGRSARTEAKVKVRQPLPRALLLHPGVTLAPEIEEEIKVELNVKTLEQVDTLSGLIDWTIIPNFRALGPRLGPKVNEVKAALAAADGNDLKRQLDEVGAIEVAGERIEAGEVEVRAQRHEAFALIEDNGWAAALDLEVSEDLRLEGQAREVIRAINDLRKELRFEIDDRVDVVIDPADALLLAVETHAATIASEVLAQSFHVGAVLHGEPSQIEIEGEPVSVLLTKP